MVTGEKLTSFPLVSDFLTQNVQPSSVTKSGPKQVEANRSQGTGGGAAGGATQPHLTLDPLFLSWVLVTQRLEATPEPGRALREEGLVHCQCHFGSEVERLGCLRSPLPRPHPATLYQTKSSECTSCAHSPDSKGPHEGPALTRALDWSVLIPAQWLGSHGLPPWEPVRELGGFPRYCLASWIATRNSDLSSCKSDFLRPAS